MANIVEDILDQATLIAGNTLGPTSQELRHKYEIERNDTRTAKFAYGVIPLAAAPAETVTKSFALDQVFETILTDTIPRDFDDDQRDTVLKRMYDNADDIFRAMINTKLNLGAVVWNVSQPSISEHEFFQDQKILVLRMDYVVKYRSLL